MSSTRKIIDLRSRPSFLHDFYGATPGTQEYEVAKWLNRRVGSKHDEHFVRSHTLQGFVDEVRESGITTAVVVGRDTPSLSISNDRIMEITAPHEELIGIASVDPQTHGVKAALAEIERATSQLGLRGINVEPGFGNPAVATDDAQFLPVYDACAQLGIPVFIMSGPTTPNFAHTDPAPIGRIARQFPNLNIVVYHGCYPYVNEIIGVAFRYENVHLVPDMYLFQPGSSLYVEAANSFLRDQLLFATSYPFRAMRQTVDDFLNLGFKEEVLDSVLYKNAERVLKLA
jgi:predicted TIM-barrel fold metal-dependent hydrolase